ncbi:MAG: hypothetical protein ACOYOV_12430 [Bacteroidales bacterium]
MDRKINIFDMIGSLIPGYQGYAERDGRRNCDKILRDCISNDLLIIEKNINERINSALSGKEFELAKKFEVCRKNINTLFSKIKYSSYGATAFFSDNQIKEEEIMQTYKIDLMILEIVEVLKKQVNDILPLELNKLIVSIQDILSKRENFINTYK